MSDALEEMMRRMFKPDLQQAMDHQIALMQRMAQITGIAVWLPPAGNVLRFSTTGIADFGPIHEMDVRYDGVPLRTLLESDRLVRRERANLAAPFTPAQRAAIAAQWSAELRAKVRAAEYHDKNQVRVDLQDEP